jgi:hypothetical protein
MDLLSSTSVPFPTSLDFREVVLPDPVEKKPIGTS